MPEYKYQSTQRSNITIKTANRHFELNNRLILEAIHSCNDIMKRVNGFDIDIISILGMRNLSAFVGEVFVVSLEKESNGLLKKNPHQDGYPDLLLMDGVGKTEWNKHKNILHSKEPFSPFATGGFEVKATVGTVPTPKELAKKGLTKPQIGDQRIELLKGYDWKAHHRETNNLFGIVWDFIDGLPIITAVFFSSNLEEEDWGKIVQPKKGGGRTTSVSIMSRVGIRKMYEGWLFVLDDERYSTFFNWKNKGNLMI